MYGGLQIGMRVFFWPLKLLVLFTITMLSACSSSSSSLPPSPAATDQLSPNVSQTSPLGGVGNIPIDANIVIEFSEPMLPVSFDDNTSFLVQSLSGANVYGQFSFNDTIVTFNPDNDFQSDTTYNVTISTGVTDLAGNALDLQNFFNFTTGADVIPPTVTFLSPLDNDAGVATLPGIVVSFSELMLATSINSQTFWLTDANGVTVNGMVDYDPAMLRATFTPLQKLSLLEIFTVTLTPGAAGIRDLAGNGIPATGNEITFSTLDGTWGVTTELLSSGSQAALNPYIVADQNGNALAVWSENNGLGVYTLRSKRYINDGSTGWINVTNPIQNVNTVSVFNYELAMNANGDAIVVWANDGRIYYNRFTNGNWGTAATIDNGARSALSSAIKVAMAANGNAVTIWEFNGNVWSNTFNPGSMGVVNGTWSGATLVEGNQARVGVSATGQAYAADVVINNSGASIATYAHNTATFRNVWVNHAPFLVSQTQPVEFIDERLLEWGTIAMNDSGQALLVWQFELVDPGSGAKSLENWANRYVPGVGWGTAQRISSAGLTAWYPEVVIEANGDGIAFFYEDGIPKVAHFITGSGWNAPIPVGGQAGIINTMDRSVNGMVTTGWSQNGFSSNRYKSGLGWQGQSQVVAPTGTSMNRLNFGTAASGITFAVWRQYNAANSAYDIYANVLKD